MALGLIGLVSDEPSSPLHGLLLLALLTTGVRYGRRGLVGGGLAAGVVMELLIGVQTQVFGVLEPPRVSRLMLSDALLLGVTSLVIASLLRAATTWRRWHDERHAVEATTLTRLACGLSLREYELVPLLARDDLTYQQIGDALDPAITARTVRTYVERLQQKLGVTGGRKAVVRAARERGLLPPHEPAAARADTDSARRSTGADRNSAQQPIAIPPILSLCWVPNPQTWSVKRIGTQKGGSRGKMIGRDVNVKLGFPGPKEGHSMRRSPSLGKRLLALLVGALVGTSATGLAGLLAGPANAHIDLNRHTMPYSFSSSN